MRKSDLSTRGGGALHKLKCDIIKFASRPYIIPRKGDRVGVLCTKWTWSGMTT